MEAKSGENPAKTGICQLSPVQSLPMSMLLIAGWTHLTTDPRNSLSLGPVT
jgi:hypothetical protein